MTLADIVAVMSGPDRVRITKGSNELFAGYLGNLVHMVMIAMLPHQKTPQQTAAHTREARQRKETL